MTWYRQPPSQPVQSVAKTIKLKNDNFVLLSMLLDMFGLLSVRTPCGLFLRSCVTFPGTGGLSASHSRWTAVAIYLMVVLPVEGSQGCSTRRVSPLALKLLPPAQQKQTLLPDLPCIQSFCCMQQH